MSYLNQLRFGIATNYSSGKGSNNFNVLVRALTNHTISQSSILYLTSSVVTQ